MITKQRFRIRRVLPVPILAFQLLEAKVLLKEENKPTFLLTKFGQLLSRVCLAGRIASISDSEKVFRFELEDPTGIVQCLFFKSGLFSHPEVVKDELSVLNSLSTGDEVLVIGKVRYEQYRDQEGTRIIIEQSSKIDPDLELELHQRAVEVLRETLLRSPQMPDVYLKEAQAYYGKIQNFQTELAEAATALEKYFKTHQKESSTRSKRSSSAIKKEAKGELEISKSETDEGDTELRVFEKMVLEKLRQNDRRISQTELSKLKDATKYLDEILQKFIKEGKIFINHQEEIILI